MAEQSRRQQIEDMLAEDPRDTFLRYCLGMEYVGAGQHEAASRCFQELLRIARGRYRRVSQQNCSPRRLKSDSPSPSPRRSIPCHDIAAHRNQRLLDAMGAETHLKHSAVGSSRSA